MKPSKAFKSVVGIFSVLLFVSACASKPAVPAPESRPQYPPTVETPIPPDGTDPGPTPSERPRVALALGGAGVASFATVGILKRLFEEGIGVDYIVTTGWPTLFALGYGFLKSVHDLEWFAMRLHEKDFFKSGMFDRSDPNSQEKLSALIENTFKQHDLSEATTPVFISAANTGGDSVLYEKGDWKEPFFKTMSVPGIFRPYPKDGPTEWISSLQGIDVSQAVSKGAPVVVAVQMYDDYFDSVRKGGEANDRAFRQLYLNQLKKSLREETKRATIVVDIQLKREPSDFTARRNAILAGYREGAKIARALRK